MNNQIKKIETVPQMTAFLTTDAVKNKINGILGDKKSGAKFISTLVSAVQQTPALAQCDSGSLINCGLLAHTLGLEPSPQLGYFYLVPFNKSVRNADGSWEKIKVATPVLGYKGYIQLALRSGQYKNINTLEVKRGELKSYNRLTEELEFEWVENDLEREKLPTIGYVAALTLVNGFSKLIYWSKEKMEVHATKYSQSYAKDLKDKKQESFWSQNFDEQAKKTMIRQLISKWGVLTSELKEAYEKDTAYLKDNGEVEYVDNVKDDIFGESAVEEVKTITEEQQDILLQAIVNKGLNIPDYFKSKNIENANYITVDEFNQMLKELE